MTTPAVSGQSVVLYHSNCADGFMSAYLCYLYHQRINKPCEFIAVNYNQPSPEGLEGKDVMIVDFSYSVQELEKIALIANRVVLLDHHKGAADQYGGYGQKFLTFVSDTKPELGEKKALLWLIEELSGCGIVMAYLDSSLQQFPEVPNFCRNERIQFLISRIQDRDLWRFEFGEESKVVHQMLTSQPYSFELMDKIVFEETQTEFNLRFAKAQAALDYKKQLVAKWSKHFDYAVFQGHTIKMINCPSDFSSDIGEATSLGEPFVLMYAVSRDRVYCSLRSHADSQIDLTQVAKPFGGSGHLHAAGFSIPVQQLPNLLAGAL